jgi:uncharacterized membrane protein (UPF0127 family)
VSHFLAPLLGRDVPPLALVNARTGAVLASHVEIAADSAARRRGLLGRDGLEHGHALVLAPCSAVHTWFMRFPIDVVFASRDGRVLKTAERVGPWRMRGSLRAFATIELRAGALGSTGIAPGDRILVQTAV